MNSDWRALRARFSAYPREALFTASERALRAQVKNEAERKALSRLLTAWLVDETEMVEAPPFSPDIFEALSRALREGAH